MIEYCDCCKDVDNDGQTNDPWQGHAPDRTIIEIIRIKLLNIFWYYKDVEIYKHHILQLYPLVDPSKFFVFIFAM